MIVEIINKKFEDVEINRGDIFYSKELEEYLLLTSVGDCVCSLICLNQSGNYYSNDLAELKFKDIVSKLKDLIAKGELIHYQRGEIKTTLTIEVL